MQYSWARLTEAGTFADVLTSLRIQTTNKEYSIGKELGKPFKFNVPKDHHVVGFCGRAGKISLNESLL